jgi:serine/threonine protein kinase
MTRPDPRTALDTSAPPFDRFKNIQALAKDRRGHVSAETARHHLFVGNDPRTGASVLIKAASKPGLTYQENLSNEIATLSRVNERLPDSPYFPVVKEHGRLRDGRLYVVESFFHEFPLATTITRERIPGRTGSYLRIAAETAQALGELHSVKIYHVDLNPMNILVRAERDVTFIRIIDFESSYDLERYTTTGAFYNPPTTPGYAAPELGSGPPDARADVYSLGAVFYTMLAGYGWTWKAELMATVRDDRDLDDELKGIVLRSVDPDPAGRYATVEEFRADLVRHLDWLWKQ